MELAAISSYVETLAALISITVGAAINSCATNGASLVSIAVG